MTNKPLLYSAAFAAGLTTLGIELATARLLGNIYGTSDVAWAAIIAMVLAYLTIGYFVGGRWADRSPHAKTLYQLLAWAAVSSAVLPLVARPVLLGAGVAFARIDVPAIILWVLLTLVIFVVPLTLLGAVTPFVIRLGVEDKAQSGKVAGRVYALNTFGSLIGAFGAVLVLIPQVGTTPAFPILAALPLGIALVGLFRESTRLGAFYAPMAAVLVAIYAAGQFGVIKPPPPGLTLLYEEETAYNLVQVVETPNGTRYMLLNEGVAIHSIYHPEIPVAQTGGVWDYFLVAPYFNEPPYTPDDVESIAIIGLAGGTVAQQYTGVYGDIPIVGVEIDPALARVGEEYFGMTMDNLDVRVADGRVVLERAEGPFSIIAIDAYRVPYVPWHMTTVEFFEEARAKLTDDGVILLNVGRTPINRDLIDAITSTLTEVYPSVYVIDVPNTFNSMVIATKQPTDVTNLRANLNNLPPDAHPLLISSLAVAAENIVPTEPSDVVLTDDHAPVEGIVHELVLEFLLAGETGAIQPLGGEDG